MMDTYEIYYWNGIKAATVQATSYEQALELGLGCAHHTYTEIPEDDFYDVRISRKDGNKFFWIRFG